MQSAVWDTELLEWEPPDRSTNALNLRVDLEANETENQTYALRIQYAGEHKSEDITGTFAVDHESSEAVEGEHFEILTGNTVTIPAGSSVSEEIEFEIFSGNIENGESLNLLLVITDEGDVPPMENYKEFNVVINKDDGFIQAMEVTITPPGNVNTANMLNAVTGEIFSINDGISDPALQRTADFGLFNSSSTDLTILAPTSSRLSGWGSGRTLEEEWADENKVESILIKLPVSTDNLDLFNSIQEEEDVRDAFYAAEDRAAELGLDDNIYGPGTHLSFVSGGELLFLKSDRGVYAIAYVEDALPGGGSVGFADLLLKQYAED